MNTILKHSTPTSTVSPETHHLLNQRRWCHLATTFKLCRE